MTRTALAARAFRDNRLSLRARGLIGYLALTTDSDTIPTSTDLSRDMREGRDAIRAAVNELIEYGYLERENVRRSDGGWARATRFAGSNVTQIPETRAPENPSLGSQRTVKPQVAPKTENPSSRRSLTSDVVTSRRTSSSSSLRSLRNVAERRFEGGDQMQLGKFGDEPKSATPAAGRAAPRDKRKEREIADWSIPDLIAEFNDRTEASTSRFGQLNRAALSGNISRLRRSGVTNVQVLRAMDLFFEDPRNLDESVNSSPLWKKFVWWFTTNQMLVAEATGTEKSGLDEMVEQVQATGALLGTRRF